MFQHSYELTFANAAKFIEINPPYAITPDNIIDEVLEKATDSNSITLTQHHISFNIIHDGSTNTKGNKIIITNPPQNLVDKLSQEDNANTTVLLKAGYVTGSPIVPIFKGTVMAYERTKEGNLDRLTLEVSDSGVNIKEARTFRSYPKNTPLDDIVQDLLKDLNIPKNIITPLGEDEKLQSFHTLQGNTLQQLKRILERKKYVATFQNYSITILPEDSTKAISGVVLSDTGGTVIGEPTLKSNAGSNKQGDSEANNPQIKIKTLLNGNLLVGDTILLDTERFENTYVKVVSVIHEGEYEGNKWFSNLIVEKVKKRINTITKTFITQEDI